jgi:hypothetical protein
LIARLDWIVERIKSFWSLIRKILTDCYDTAILYIDQSFNRVNSQKKTSKQNFAESSAGANILFASKGIVNKKAILDSSNEVYLILPDCAATFDFS